MSNSVLSATDIVPNLYDEGTIEQDCTEDKVDDLSYDTYNLFCGDYSTLKCENENDKESLILATATRATQLLIKKIFECPTEPSVVGPVAVLPAEVLRLPREKKVPEPKPETKWEKFAREKNIKHKKKDRMVFDDTVQEYRPRYGYKGINSGIDDHAIVEVKSGQDRMKDPWAEAKTEKKSRVMKETKKQVRNLSRGKNGITVAAKGPYDPKAVPGIPLDLVDKGKKRGKEGVQRALQLVQHSTASMGRFDEARRGEPAKKIKGKKRSYQDNMSTNSEKAFMKSQLRIVADKVDKKARGVTNSLSAYEGILPDAPSDRFRQRKGKGKAEREGSGPPKKKAKRS